MSCCYKVIANLVRKIREKNNIFISKIQTHWDETEKFDKNNISVGHLIKLYYLVANHISVMNLFCQSIEKEITKPKIKGIK